MLVISRDVRLCKSFRIDFKQLINLVNFQSKFHCGIYLVVLFVAVVYVLSDL